MVVFLSGESHGQRSLVGCSPWGLKGSDMTEQLSTQHEQISILLVSFALILVSWVFLQQLFKNACVCVCVCAETILFKNIGDSFMWFKIQKCNRVYFANFNFHFLNCPLLPFPNCNH